MTSQPSRPRRPGALIAGLVLALVASLLYAMAYLHISPGQSYSLAHLALFGVVFAFWFNWARFASVVLLIVLTAMLLVGAFREIGDPASTMSQPVTYVLLGAVATVVAGLLVFSPAANDFYAQRNAKGVEVKKETLT